MSYARFGDHSDVYVFRSSLGIECCFCCLQDREWIDDPDRPFGGYLRDVGEHVQDTFQASAEMLEHLALHTAAGHEVPESAIARLRAEAAA